MFQKPKFLYHGSPYKIEGLLRPVLKQDSSDHIHSQPSIFATERVDIASLFMFPIDTLASIGFEHDIAFICIWGTREEFRPKDNGGYLYTLSADTFKKIGKNYEWQSFESVKPLEIKKYDSVIEGIISCGAKVYFVNDNDIFDRIRDNKNNRMPILKNLKNENKSL